MKSLVTWSLPEPTKLSAATKRLGGLPPDPDGLNDVRAERISVVMRAYQKFNDNDTFADFMCDLKHWCDRQPNLDVKAELERAERNYLGETWNDDT